MKTLNFRTIVLLACLSFFGSCLTSQKVDKEVAKQYNDRPQTSKKKQVDFITVSSSLVPAGESISTTETKTSNMLPLLVYWQWNYTNTCTLNPQIPVNNFTATVLSGANKVLKEKLEGQKLELSVDKIPNKFVFDDKAHLIFLIYAFGWDNVSIKTDNIDMVVSYKVLKDGSEIKTGVITIPYNDDKTRLGMFKSWKSAISEYLDQYDANIKAMSKQVVDKLVKEL